MADLKLRFKEVVYANPSQVSDTNRKDKEKGEKRDAAFIVSGIFSNVLRGSYPAEGCTKGFIY